MNSLNYFDSIANNWNVIRSEYFEEKLKYKVLSKAEIDNKIAADLGCGTGFISLALAEKANLVFSLDQSNNMLKELKKEISKKDITNIYAIKSDLENIVLFDESVDDVFINMALHHVVNVDKAISEIYRVLKKGGSIVISDVTEHDGQWAREEMYDEWLGFSNEQINNWLSKYNFKNIEIENTDLYCKGYSSKGEYTETKIFIASAKKL
ncbi:ubiquinone/menaquinone biosynthesis C-methylase UbiE [Clostridium tetanomorphum]|uniref:Class I SAM-dependent methyltransferase n=1 Tax=Clostridium tetanomorphum TaxID=1553 RepID=A0A923E9Q7_CLOTT|nr:class I SAM-dependent methyltransferase [Clostridium tetanomorphum]KAJ51400.1 SAM-dependent methyltransferase [Clostridium tetanomorphum DSM 665]MBC2396393.1 class I SAM-dependent methyltransferase [Clostridium tetanomorphum]MBP1863377.1 ubiquinone/menaquinone biosynthesis C-methylase UbiE [Clostridium tetanomorphum]NRS83474.1 ubiquinone/menaquinone biosynthesis C-methylase UbiE [Clostridium tetanomorphum]NRZ96674.1 ubiquinone/menaquinone biosynthesis C-methylase UbiE [Clostridium tetanomor